MNKAFVVLPEWQATADEARALFNTFNLDPVFFSHLLYESQGSASRFIAIAKELQAIKKEKFIHLVLGNKEGGSAIIEWLKIIPEEYISPLDKYRTEYYFKTLALLSHNNIPPINIIESNLWHKLPAIHTYIKKIATEPTFTNKKILIEGLLEIINVTQDQNFLRILKNLEEHNLFTEKLLTAWFIRSHERFEGYSYTGAHDEFFRNYYDGFLDILQWMETNNIYNETNLSKLFAVINRKLALNHTFTLMKGSSLEAQILFDLVIEKHTPVKPSEPVIAPLPTPTTITLNSNSFFKRIRENNTLVNSICSQLGM